MRRGVAVLALLGCALLFFPAVSAEAQSVSDETRFAQLLNAARASYGLAPLRIASDLTAMAREHAAEMAGAGDIWHQSLRSIDGMQVGENVGAGSSADQIHGAFMDSPTHRDNIVGPYSEVGIGVVVSNGTLYVDQLFREPWPAAGSPPATTPPATQPAPEPEPEPEPVAVEPAPVTSEAAPVAAPIAAEPAPAPQPAAAPTVSDAAATSAVARMALPLMFVAATADHEELAAASVLPAVSVRTRQPARAAGVGPQALVAGALIALLFGSHVRVLRARR